MKERRTLIFANPAACGGMTKERHEALERLKRRLGGRLLGLESKSREEFLELMLSESAHGDLVIIAGGDGSLHDGINALWKKRLSLGYIPFGTGNAAGYALSILEPGASTLLHSFDEEKIFEILKIGREKTIDLIEVKSPSLSKPEISLFSSVGWCALMAGKRKRRGLLGYMSPALKNVFGNYYEQRAEVIVDNQKLWSGKSTFVILSKSRFYGAGVLMVPEAVLDDGQIHLALYELSRREVTALYAKSFLGFEPRADLTSRGRKVEIRSLEGALPLQCDGEYMGTSKEVTFEVLPGAMNFIIGDDR